MSPRAKSGKKVLTGQTLSVGEPLVEAARHLLPPRFEGLQRAVAESLGSQTDDPEPIHRLRVASRRCATAIELLGVLIPRDLRRPLLRDLKKLRRDCGPARDLDIQRAFYERLLGEVETQDLAVVDLLYERVSTHREKRQNQLIKGIEKRCRKLDRGCADVLAHLDLLRDRNPDPCGTLGETALPLLSGLLQRVCDLAPPSDASATQLHRLRIAGKKLRYACELFEPLLGPDYTRHLAPHLVALQDELGQQHDSEVAGEHLAELRRRWKRKRHDSSWERKPQGLFSWRELSAGMQFVARLHAERAAASREQFFQLWPGFSTTEFRQPLEARLKQLSDARGAGPGPVRSTKADLKSRRSTP
jgi:CHAD domain-containing protein